MRKRFRKSRASRLPWRQRLAARLLTLPDGALTLLTGGAVVVDGQQLEPCLAAVCRVANRRRKLQDLEPAKARRHLESLGSMLPRAQPLMDRIEEREIPGPEGSIPIRIYTPPDLRRSPPALAYFHGGGWVLGNLETSDVFCRLIAGQTPCKVISVDYRLAPEHPFPAPLHDALAAYRWVWDQADELGVDRRRLAVGGDSAGGNLAAVVSAELAGADQRPAAQFLIYPVTSARRDTASYELFAQGFVLERELMEYFFHHYLGNAHESAGDDPRISPLAGGLADLPPTVIATAGFDVLRDEGDAYAEKLRSGGVTVVHRRYPRLMHSFASMSGLPPARRALDELISDLATLFHRRT